MKKRLIWPVLLCLIWPENSYAARLWSTGFEIGSTANGGEFDTVVGAISYDTTTKRSGAQSLRCNGNDENVRHRFIADTSAQLYFRFYLNAATLPSSGNKVLMFTIWDGGVGNRLRLGDDGKLYLYDWNDVTLLGTSTTALSTGTWYRIEVSHVISVGNFTMTVRINGTEEINVTAADVTGGVGAFILGIVGNANTADLYFDDVAVNDTSGTSQTSWPGAGSIAHMNPSAAGDNAMGARGGTDTGSDHGQVNQVPFNDASYYVLDVNNDIIDLNLPTAASVGIGASDTITLVQVGARIAGSATGNFTYNTRIKSQASGTVASGTVITVNSNQIFVTHDDAVPKVYSLTSYTDPQAGGAWTPSLLDSAQIGVIAPDAAPDCWVGELWALVEYVPKPKRGAVMEVG